MLSGRHRSTPCARRRTLQGLDPPDAAGTQGTPGIRRPPGHGSSDRRRRRRRATPFSFCYSSVTGRFHRRVSAYFHYDSAFTPPRRGWGSTSRRTSTGRRSPFPWTTGFSALVNAFFAIGNTTSNGMGKFINGLAAAGCPVGIAGRRPGGAARVRARPAVGPRREPQLRVVPQRGRQRSGSSCTTPGRRGAPDRFLTFVQRGDRPRGTTATGQHRLGVGRQPGDDRQYQSEQILSTTMFRIYRSAGGDDADARDRSGSPPATWSWLIVKAIGTLAVTRHRSPDGSSPPSWTPTTAPTAFEGHPGGAWGKVVRWSFEQQGLFQAAGSPTPVSDGRGAARRRRLHRRRPRRRVHALPRRRLRPRRTCGTAATPDGGTTHEAPVVWRHEPRVRPCPQPRIGGGCERRDGPGSSGVTPPPH